MLHYKVTQVNTKLRFSSCKTFTVLQLMKNLHDITL